MSTDFQKAVLNRNAAAIRDLLAKGVAPEEINHQDAHGNTPLNYLCAMGTDEDVIVALIAKGADVKMPNKNGAVPLIHAVYSKMSPVVIKALVDAGADVNFQNDSGGTALQIACVCKAGADVINALVDLGADVDLANSHGHTPLTFAVRNHNDYAIIDLIAGKSKNINAKIDNDDPKYPGFTALHFAAGEGMAAAAAVLITHGADTSVTNRDGYTPLQLADENTHKAMVSSSFARFAQSNPPPAEARAKSVRAPLRRTSLLAQTTTAMLGGAAPGTPPDNGPRAASSGGTPPLEGVKESAEEAAAAGGGDPPAE